MKWWLRFSIISRIICVTIWDAFKLQFKLLGKKSAAVRRTISNAEVNRWGNDILKIFKVDLQLKKPDNFNFIPEKSYVLMSNHASHMDIPILFATFAGEKIGMLAKKELFKIPFLGMGMRLGGCVAIDREDPRQAVLDLREAERMMLEEGIRLWVSPEGTRSLDGNLGRFKKGGFRIALATHATIVPISIVGAHELLPAKTLDFHPGTTIKVLVGEPIDTANCKTEDLEKLMAVVHERIAAGLTELRG